MPIIPTQQEIQDKLDELTKLYRRLYTTPTIEVDHAYTNVCNWFIEYDILLWIDQKDVNPLKHTWYLYHDVFAPKKEGGWGEEESK